MIIKDYLSGNNSRSGSSNSKTLTGRRSRKFSTNNQEFPWVTASNLPKPKSSKGFKLIVTPYHNRIKSEFLQRNARSVLRARRRQPPQLPSSVEEIGLFTPRSAMRSPKNKSPKRSYSEVKDIAFDLIKELDLSQQSDKQMAGLGRVIPPVVEQLMQIPYIKNKFKKFAQFFMKLEKTEKMTLQRFLFHLTSSSLPKYTGISAYKVHETWGLIQREFDSICAEIKKVLFKMKLKEIQVMNLKKRADEIKKIRGYVAQRLKMEMGKEKVPVDFGTSSRQLESLLGRMHNRGKRWASETRSFDIMRSREQISIEPYRKRWDKIEHMEVKDFRRRKRRLFTRAMLMKEREVLRAKLTGDFHQISTLGTHLDTEDVDLSVKRAYNLH